MSEQITLQDKYREIFSTGAGRDVLADILVNFCHFGCFLKSEKEVAEYNVGISILAQMGIIAKGKVLDFVNKIIK